MKQQIAGQSTEVISADSRGEGRDKTKYLLNGKIYGKGKLVLAVVKTYVKAHPSISAKELQSVFNDNLQGGAWGVVRLSSKAQKHDKRYFADEIETATDTCRVCNQWGIGNIGDFLAKAEELGYEIKPISGESPDTLAGLLRQVLEGYPGSELLQNHPLRKVIERKIPDTIKKSVAIPSTYKVPKGKLGSDNFPDEPRVGIMDMDRYKFFTNGIFVVYLFAPNENSVELVLIQGVRGTTKDVLAERAEYIRKRVPCPNGFSADNHIANKSSKYKDGVIYHKTYSINSIPENHEIISDLNALLDVYKNIRKYLEA